MIYQSQKSLTDQGIQELPTGCLKVSEPPSPEVQVGKTSCVGVSSLPEDHQNDYT